MQQEEAQKSWARGGNGLTLFHATTGFISIGVHRGAAWCEKVTTQLISTSKGLFEVVDKKTSRSYQLAYTITSLSVFYLYFINFLFFSYMYLIY